MEDWVKDVILKWKSEGVELNPPATIFEIENTETVLSYKFPPDFKALYLYANGFASFDMQEHMFSLWSLNAIIEEFKNVYADSNFIGFCDFLIASHFIGFAKDRSGIFKHYNYTEKKAIARTFKELVEMINSGDKEVY